MNPHDQTTDSDPVTMSATTILAGTTIQIGTVPVQLANDTVVTGSVTAIDQLRRKLIAEPVGASER